MEKISAPQYAKLVKAGKHLDAAAKSMRVLTSIEWAASHKTRFLKTGRLPQPVYAKVDVSAARNHIADAKRLLDGDDVVSAWLKRIGETLGVTASMIQARGTSAFFDHSAALYGQPTRVMLDRQTRVLDLAKHMDEALLDLDFDRLVVEGVEQSLSDSQFARALRSRLSNHFHADDVPSVEISATVSAKAAASSTRIRVRQGAEFTSRDVDQLLQHEALIHTATALNGKIQKDFPILARSHPGTTEIQEGLAVFAEIITGAMDPRRFKRLSGRVLAIQMAVDGADFKEVYDFFVDRIDGPSQAYDNARRVMRGGLIEGGAPFTKDMVYLNGLLRVHNFMRTVVRMNRADLIRMLFVGKMDIEDVPALSQLAYQKRLAGPKYMPPWVSDLRFLVSYMAYSGFLNRMKMPGFQAYYEQELTDVPSVWSLMRHDRIDQSGEDIIE